MYVSAVRVRGRVRVLGARICMWVYTYPTDHMTCMPMQVLKKNPYNKYDHDDMKNINVLNVFHPSNEEALRQLALDFIADGAIVINRNGAVVASGVTVLDLAKGSQNGGKKTAAASSAAQGDAKNDKTLAVSIKLSEDACGTDLDISGKMLQIFNGALDGELGKEGCH